MNASISVSHDCPSDPMPGSSPIRVGGLTPFSTIDYPGHMSAVIFCQGCPWRCSYCHNPHLLASTWPAAQNWGAFVAWLEGRRALLEAVVFSGGEPLLQRGLVGAVEQVRAMGFRVGLHTAGAYPDQLTRVLPLIDWVGFDVKSAFCDYPRITGVAGGEAARRSLQRVLESRTSHEVRCTVDETILNADDAARMSDQLCEMGVKRLILQACRDVDGVQRTISTSFINAVTGKFIAVDVRG